MAQHGNHYIEKEKFLVERDLGLSLFSFVYQDEENSKKPLNSHLCCKDFIQCASFEDQRSTQSDSNSLFKAKPVSYFPAIESSQTKSPAQTVSYESPAHLSINSEFYLAKGSLFNDLLLYQDAITELTRAIQDSPSLKEAYIERALAYFETNQINLAIKDYKQARHLNSQPPFLNNNQLPVDYCNPCLTALYVPDNRADFAQGLLIGATTGAKESTIDFVPSIFSCCRGILHGLWAFVCSPLEVSQEMVKATYAVGEFISRHSTEECFQCVVPELKELSLSWHSLNDHSKGQKIGYIIGKYGVDIFAPAGALKGINKLRALKRANTMCTLESCAASQAKQAKILEESIKRAAIREKIISDSIKNGKILVRNSNTQIHIIQPKHAWDKVIKITGNVEEDCKNVVKLLEDNKIFLEKYRKNTTIRPEFTRYDHQIQINGYEVKAVFNKNPETGEIFLNDAWIVVK